MSDTPKRNEAVARWNMELRSGCISIELKDDGQWVDYDDHAETVAALQGEVSRLRAAADAALRVWRKGQEKTPVLSTVFTKDLARLREALINLEPPTDGR